MALRLAASPTDEHREIAATLAAVIDERDYRTALAMASTAARPPDLHAEKIVSRRYRYLWICNPKAASRSIIAALRAADPDAELIRNRTLDEILEARPELMRRVHLRGHSNVFRRLLVHVCGANLGLLTRELTGVGTPRSLQGRGGAFLDALIRALRRRWPRSPFRIGSSASSARFSWIAPAPQRHQLVPLTLQGRRSVTGDVPLTVEN